MIWQFTPYAVPLFVGAAIMLGIAVTAWQRRTIRGAVPVILIGLCAIIYSIGYAFELGSQTIPAVLFWLKVEYIGIVATPVTLLAFVLAYTGQRRLTPLAYSLLLAIPAMTLIFAWTNEYHEMIWRGISLDLSGGFTRTLFTRGAWGWFHIAYFQLVMLASVVLLFWAFFRASGLYRGQIGVMLSGIVVPLGVNVLYLARLTPPGLDLNPYALIVTGVVLAWGMFRYRLLDIVPVARKAVLDSMRDAVIVLDAQDRVIELNPAAGRLVGLDEGHTIGQPAAEIFSQWPGTLAAYRDREQAHEEIAADIEGEERFFDMHLLSLRGQSGRLEGRLVVLHDITDRVQTDAILREIAERLTILRMVDAELTRKLDVGHVTGTALDAAMRMSLADAAFICFAEAEGLRVIRGLGHYPQEALDRLLPLDSGITARVVHTREPELVPDVTADPDYLPIVPGTRTQISAPLLSGQKLIGVLTLEAGEPGRFTPDIFGLVKLLAARAAVAIDNAHAYEERDRLVQELDAFARTVAHDLKGPVATIGGYAGLALAAYDELSAEAVKDNLRRIQRGAEQANEIIHALLLLAGVRTSQTVEIAPLDMETIVAEARSRLSYLIEQHEAQVILPPSWPVASGYAPWVEEVWVNYLDNAIKYGGCPPHIELGCDGQGGSAIRFWVRDNGSGLSPSDQARLFQPFTRLDQATSEGHGLGLSIVRRIVEKLGGEVGVESAVGQGSLFYFTLPSASGRQDARAESLTLSRTR